MALKQEISPATRLLLIKLAEGFADGVRNGTFAFTEQDGRRIADYVGSVVNPQPKIRICSMAQACEYLHISQPTFRKYVRQGLLPQGIKIAGITELLWDKADIERFEKERRG